MAAFDGYRLKPGTPMTADLLQSLVGDYTARHLPRHARLAAMYDGDHAILHRRRKPNGKPDNRLVANYCKQIVDTMTGFLVGVPVRIAGDDEAAVAWLEDFGALSGTDDADAELVKTLGIHGVAYEVLWRDAQAAPHQAVAPPTECFMCFTDDVERVPLYAVRFTRDADRFDGEPDCVRGTLYTQTAEVPFSIEGRAALGEESPHGFPGVPVIEYVASEERRGLFEGVASLIEAHDDALSEKANDVDYYADAYLSVLGAELDEETLRHLRDSRIINLAGVDGAGVRVEFLGKPESDATQEHLIDRLERLIFELAMVADVSAEDFGTSSGIAIRYRLQAMGNLALTIERKFRRGLRERWRLLLGYAGTTGVDAGAWARVRPVFTRNIPANLLEESQIAANLSGIVSEETQLSVLSCVDSPKAEAGRKADEADEAAERVVLSRGDGWLTGTSGASGRTPA